MFLYFLSNLAMGASGSSTPVVSLFCYVDPAAAQLISSGADGDPCGVDPFAAELLSSGGDDDPIGVDPSAAILII